MSIGQAGILLSIIIYLVSMVYIGFYYSKKGGGDSADEFYLGGRKLGPLVTAMFHRSPVNRKSGTQQCIRSFQKVY